MNGNLIISNKADLHVICTLELVEQELPHVFNVGGTEAYNKEITCILIHTFIFK